MFSSVHSLSSLFEMSVSKLFVESVVGESVVSVGEEVRSSKSVWSLLILWVSVWMELSYDCMVSDMLGVPVTGERF